MQIAAGWRAGRVYTASTSALLRRYVWSAALSGTEEERCDRGRGEGAVYIVCDVYLKVVYWSLPEGRRLHMAAAVAKADEFERMGVHGLIRSGGGDYLAGGVFAR